MQDLITKEILAGGGRLQAVHPRTKTILGYAVTTEALVTALKISESAEMLDSGKI